MRTAILFVLLGACHRESAHKPQVAASECALSRELAPGLRVEQAKASMEPPVPLGDRCVTLVRAEPRRFELRLLQARVLGGDRTAEKWSDEFGLDAVINASMYKNDGRSVAMMIDGKSVGNPADNPKYGGFLAFGPTREGIAPVAIFGRDCPGFDLAAIKSDYRSVVQNYRLLDCNGTPIRWQDNKVFSTSVVGLDRQSRVVFAHTRTPYTMTQLAQILAAPPFELAVAMHTEGGPEASLYVHHADYIFRGIGSYETGFMANDDNHAFMPLPNVLGLSARD